MIDKTELENIRRYQYELYEQEQQLERIKSASLVSSPQSGASHGSGTSDRVGNRATLTADLQREISEKQQKIDALIDYINDISDSIVQQIVRCRCIYGFKWREIADVVGGGNTARSVNKTYERFMDKP